MSAAEAKRAVTVREPGRTRRLEQRRERILREAERLFLQHGYAGASINEIVRLSGGSLATLYGEFGSKEGLFAAVMHSRARSMFDAGAARCPPAGTAREGLANLATQILERILREDSLALYRITVSEGARFPDLRHVILQLSFPNCLQGLGSALVELGVADRAGSLEAAEDFLTLVHGQLVFRAACGETISATRRERHAERAVDAFLLLHPRRDHHASAGRS